jgi:iron complex outermembrane receptor protein
VVTVFCLFTRVVWKKQFGDEHGLGLNDAGVESVEVIKDQLSCGSDACGVLYFNPEKFADAILLKPILIKNYSQIR